MNFYPTIESETKAALIIKAAVEAAGNAGDEEMLLDCIEAETDLFEQIDALLRHQHDVKSIVAAIATQTKELQTRKARFETKDERIQFLLLQVMQAIGAQKLERANATLSLRAGSKSVFVEDEDLVPHEFCKFERKVVKTDIKKAIDAGQEVPGAKIVTGEETIAIRRA